MSEITRRGVLRAATGVLALPFFARQSGAQEAPPEIGLPGDISHGEQATITRIRTESPVLALTFDDGPHHSLTPRLLDILGERGVRATFYVIGNRVGRHASIMRRIVDEGHEVGNHSWSHPTLSRLGNQSLFSQIDRTSQVIFDTVGRAPVTMRPPYGSLSPRQRLLLHNERNLPTVLWSIDPRDWQRPGSGVITNRIVGRAHPGAVVLAHDIQSGTVRAMPGTVDALLSRGYRFATMSEILGWPRWDQRHVGLDQIGTASTG